MKTAETNSVIQALAANWWVALLRGILLVLLGLYAFFTPGLTLLTWALMVGCFLIADGVLAFIAGIAGWVDSRLWVCLRGLLALLIGGFAVAQPGLFGASAGLAFIFILAGWQVAGGILEIVVAIRERKAIEGEGWMILSGVFSILFGIVLAFAPFLALDLFIRMAGFAAIIFGFMLIFSSFKIRGLRESTNVAHSTPTADEPQP